MGDVRSAGSFTDLCPMNMSCVQKCAIKAVGQHSCLGQWYASLSLLGSVRSLKVIARDNLQDCGQFNVGRQPAYVPTRPLGPLPAAERTDEPRARTHVSGSVQNLSHFRFWLSGARPWLTR